MNSDEVNINDIIICVQEYPEDGDSAQVLFINYTALQGDTSIGCREYVKMIERAEAQARRTCRRQDNFR